MKKQEDNFEITETSKEKKSRAPVIILILVLLIAALGGAGYYLLLREQPKKTVTKFLDYAQAFNLDAMATCVYNKDLGDLEENKLNSDAYNLFFQAVNEKMSYQITGLDFHRTSATVTVDITYFDGRETYKEAVSEFFRSGMQKLFTGGDMTPQENEDLLVEILSEKAKDLPDNLTTKTVKYPLKKIDGEWYITEITADTTNVITANFGAFNEELAETSQELDSEGNDGSEDTDNSAQTEDDGVLDYTCDRFAVKYDRFELAEDYSGNQCLLVYYNYTNNTDEPSQPMVNLNLRAVQNGEACPAALPVDSNKAMDQFTAEIPAGETVSVCQSYEITDTSDVTLELSEAYSFKEDVDTQVLQLGK